jgi:hypothetical protein
VCESVFISEFQSVFYERKNVSLQCVCVCVCNKGRKRQMSEKKEQYDSVCIQMKETVCMKGIRNVT